MIISVVGFKKTGKQEDFFTLGVDVFVQLINQKNNWVKNCR